MKQDITQYSDNELSLLVFNDEGLYLMRREFKTYKSASMILSEYFTFTDDQLRVLMQDLNEDKAE